MYAIQLHKLGVAVRAPELEDLPEEDVGEWAAYRLQPTPRRE